MEKNDLPKCESEWDFVKSQWNRNQTRNTSASTIKSFCIDQRIADYFRIDSHECVSQQLQQRQQQLKKVSDLLQFLAIKILKCDIIAI